MGVYDDYIESFMNSYEVITDEKGHVSTRYIQQPTENDGYDVSAVMECAINNMYSFSLIKAIINYFKKNKVEQTMPCSVIFDMMNSKLDTGLSK